MVRRHLKIFRYDMDALGLLEVVAAVGRILAVEVKVAASLTRCLSVALDLASLAFIAAPDQPSTRLCWTGEYLPCDGNVAVALRPWLCRPSIVVLALRVARAVARGAHRIACIIPIARASCRCAHLESR